jgi:MFS family permease
VILMVSLGDAFNGFTLSMYNNLSYYNINNTFDYKFVSPVGTEMYDLMNIFMLSGATVGAFSASFLLFKRRRGLLMLADGISLVGSVLICSFWYSSIMIIIGRFLQGFSFALQRILSQVYVTEYVPESH